MLAFPASDCQGNAGPGVWVTIVRRRLRALLLS
jgi:hypothetical protein